jgi:type III restriction enzyme
MSESNPILNSPYTTPRWHYATDLKGHLNYEDIRKGRRIFDAVTGGYSMPVKKQKQTSAFEVNDMAAEYGEHLINLIREEVGKWRNAAYTDTTGATRTLLNFWFLNPERYATKSLFFAQQEAIESAIWLNEIAQRSNAGNLILQKLKETQNISDKSDNNLPRLCFKMATGSGKTVVMAALILYHYINRQEYRQDTRFCDYFLMVAPGITIKDRLGVLFVDTTPNNKNEANDYYHQRDLVPPKYERLLDGLNAKLVITNYHSFEPRTLQGNKRSPMDGKKGANGKKQEAKEEPAQVIKRLLKNFKQGSRLLLLNDEAHHCYLPLEEGKNTDDENTADENARAAIWFSGLREIAKRYQLRNVYDLSATPYYLNGSGYTPYTLFPWVVSDFGLTEAIESGLVKIPFLPEIDNTQNLQPVLRDLYEHVKDALPKKGVKKQKSEAKKEGIKLLEAPPDLPETLKTALDQFYNHYKDYEIGIRTAGERSNDLITAPPVFIAVCNNTNVSKELYKYIAGYELEDDEGNLFPVPGLCEMFNNYELVNGQWRMKRKPPTLIIDSDALENSNQINEDFKKVFSTEIKKFREEYRLRHPDKSVENLTDADMLREIVNTVGKPGALGSHIRCVVSVSMLTEGWDVNTVTHIMGLRAFGSQLLCEQVAGRALRRKQYVPVLYQETEVAGLPVWKEVARKDEHKYKPETLILKYPPEYAHIIGVPFKMFKGGATTIPEPIDYTTVKALPERLLEHEITFPNLIGYKYEITGETIAANFEGLPNYEVQAWRIPLRTLMGSAFTGDKEQMEVRDALDHREQEIFYHFTSELIRIYFNDKTNGKQFHLFGQLKNIVADWYATKVIVTGDTDQQWKKLILLHGSKQVCDAIYEGIRQGRRERGEEKVLPIFKHYERFSSTKYINGNTTKPCYETTKSHVNVVVADTISKKEDANFWEHVTAKALEELPEVLSYVKNALCDFQIPYVAEGKDHHYKPDFLIRARNKKGDTIMLILEITGANKQYKAEKKHFTETYWLPAVNSVKDVVAELGGVEWRFLEVSGEIREVKTQIVNVVNL